MPQSVRVLSATLIGDKIHVIKEITEDDGTVGLNLHIVPDGALEWRAAEYGIEPSETATLIDFLMYEPFVENKSLYEHEDRHAAREEMKTLVAEAKAKLSPKAKSAQPVGSATTELLAKLPQQLRSEEDPYTAIARHSKVNKELHDLKREHVDTMFKLRDEKLKEQEGKVPQNSAELLKSKLLTRGES